MIEDEDLAELFRESVNDLTAGATAPGASAPAALVAKVLRGQKQRKLALRAGGGFAVAAAAATTALAASLNGVAPGAGRHRPIQIETAAYVGSRIDRALAEASARRYILQVITTQVSPAGEYPRRVLLATGSRNVQEAQTRLGSPLLTQWNINNAVVQVLVNYRARTWEKVRSPRSLPDSLPPLVTQFMVLPSPGHCGVPGISPGDPAMGKTLRLALRCGALRVVAGAQRIDDTPAIKLVPAVPQRQFHPSGPVEEALWVSASTYLPLRVAFHGPTQSGISDLRYLIPTRARLALLRPVIPPGFHRIRWHRPGRVNGDRASSTA